jgi:hypothetical protein
MADDNLDDLGNSAQGAVSSLDYFINAVRRGGNVTSKELDNLAKSSDFASSSHKRVGEAGVAVHAAFKNIAATSKQATKAAYSLSDFGDTVGAVTNIAGAVLGIFGGPAGIAAAAGIKGLSSVAELALPQIEMLGDSFVKLSANGLLAADGMEDARDKLARMSVPAATLEKVLSNNSKALSAFGETSARAGDDLASTIGGMKDSGIDQELRQLGFFTEDVANAMITYGDMQRILGNNEQIRYQDLTNRTIAYGKELDGIARLTGMQRQEAEKRMQEQLRDQRFLANMQRMEAAQGREATLAFQSALVTIGERSPEVEKALMDLTGGSAAASKEAQALLASYPGVYQALERFKADPADERARAEFFASLQEGAQYAQTFKRDLVAVAGPIQGLTNQVSDANLATANMGKMGQRSLEVQDELRKNSDLASKGMNTLTGTTMNYYKNMETFGSNLTYMATGVDLAADAVELFTDGLVGATKTIVDLMRRDTRAPEPPEETANPTNLNTRAPEPPEETANPTNLNTRAPEPPEETANPTNLNTRAPEPSSDTYVDKMQNMISGLVQPETRPAELPNSQESELPKPLTLDDIPIISDYAAAKAANERNQAFIAANKYIETVQPSKMNPLSPTTPMPKRSDLDYKQKIEEIEKRLEEYKKKRTEEDVVPQTQEIPGMPTLAPGEDPAWLRTMKEFLSKQDTTNQKLDQQTAAIDKLSRSMLS